jgi:hypothetical protein
MPYEEERRVEWVVGSRPCSPAKLPSEAYWPAEEPTCQVASTLATPAWSRAAAAGEAAVSAATAAVAHALHARLPIVGSVPY